MPDRAPGIQLDQAPRGLAQPMEVGRPVLEASASTGPRPPAAAAPPLVDGLEAFVGTPDLRVTEVWKDLASKQIEEWAVEFESDNPDHALARHYTWEVRDLPVAGLISIMEDGKKGWQDWFQEEIAMAKRDQDGGRVAYLKEMEPWWVSPKNVDDPVFISLEQDGPCIWDGTHRVAVAVNHGLTTIPAFVGIPKFGTPPENGPEDEAAIYEDYGLCLADEEFREAAETTAKNLADALDLWERVRVLYIMHDEDLGRYRGDSHTDPIVMISPLACQAYADEHLVPTDVVIATTVAHEIGHALLELATNEGIEIPGDEEELAESVAHSWHFQGKLPAWATQFLETRRGLQAPKVTASPEFRAWFGQSKVVDGNGEPVVMAHGTPHDFTTFRENDGIWFGAKGSSEVDVAILDEGDEKEIPAMPSPDPDWFPEFPVGARSIPVYLRIENPADLNKGWPDVEDLIQKGFDGAIDRDTETGEITCAVVFSPSQIKSAIGNSGDFDPQDPDVRR